MNRVEGFNKIQSRLLIQEDGCHVWLGAKNDSLYGVQKIDGKFRYVHRFIYDYKIGIPEGLSIDHVCKNTLCCNIDHLRPLSYFDNAIDGMRVSVKKNTKTICNIHNIERSVTKNGKRYCLECNRIRYKKYILKKNIV